MDIVMHTRHGATSLRLRRHDAPGRRPFSSLVIENGHDQIQVFMTAEAGALIEQMLPQIEAAINTGIDWADQKIDARIALLLGGGDA